MLFICDLESCVNAGKEYVFEGETERAECGGCGSPIMGTPIQKEEQNG